jgi:hypothetical protein
MRIDGDQVRLAASDAANFLACRQPTGSICCTLAGTSARPSVRTDLANYLAASPAAHGDYTGRGPRP